MTDNTVTGQTEACETCDGTGCPCFRQRDWQSIDQDCHDGCPECGLNTCTATSLPRGDV